MLVNEGPASSSQASKEKRAIADGQCVTAANFLRERLEKVACSPESEAGSATRKLLVKVRPVGTVCPC